MLSQKNYFFVFHFRIFQWSVFFSKSFLFLFCSLENHFFSFLLMSPIFQSCIPSHLFPCLFFFGFSSLVMTSICEAISSNQLALRFGVGVVRKGYGYKMGCYLKGQQKSLVSSLLIIFVIKLSQNPWTPPHMTVMSFLDNHLNLIN